MAAGTTPPSLRSRGKANGAEAKPPQGKPFSAARWIVAWLCLIAMTASASEPNAGFEAGLAGWKKLWTRDPGAGECAIDRQLCHTGGQSARIVHRGERDWSFEPEGRIAVESGDVFELEVWLKLEGPGTATLCVATVDSNDRTLAWSFGERTTGQRHDWFKLATRLVIPPGVARIQPRLIGSGAATVWLDDFNVRRKENLASLRRGDLPLKLSLTNDLLRVTLTTSNAAFSVRDQRSGREWVQLPSQPEVMVLTAAAEPDQIRFELLHLSSGRQLKAAARLERARPELVIELEGDGELSGALAFPYPFVSNAGEYLVVPMNEGISYPVEDRSIEPMRLIAYGGHGICMAFWGVTDGANGHMAIIETPDDAAIRLNRLEGNLAVGPEWESQKGQFGYARRLRYIFFSTGGHVAMAKRYRAYARDRGLLRTLADKRRANPSVDLLIGAVNVWCWDRDPVSLIKELKALGIERVLWSNRQDSEGIRAMNDLGVLTSRYDIYQDAMDPANYPKLRWLHPDWTSHGWPKDLMLDSSGRWIRGWEVEGKDDQRYPCGVLCDRVAPDYARRRIPAELDTHPYRSRFLDTTTASSWRECYAPDHPLTRSESRRWKMELLRYVSEDCGLVTGSETGHDAAVPFVHYFEGMLSLGPYRVPDSGRDMQRIWTEVPEPVAKFQLGHRYRLPLWELVFHDCVVSHWYWGDYNNKLPALWDKRDLLNVLYGTPPMFMFNWDLWARYKLRFLQSYQATSPAAHAVGYSEMIDHRFLTPDRDVQQTIFANGVTVTVNFGTQPLVSGETRVPAMSSQIEGLGPERRVF